MTREDLALDDSEDDKKALADAAADLKPLTDYMKKVLGDRVEKVAASNRLTDSPAVVVSSKFGWSANMERVMKGSTVVGPVALVCPVGWRSSSWHWPSSCWCSRFVSRPRQ